MIYISSADEGKMTIKEAEPNQHECLGCFEDRSNLTHSNFFGCWLHEGNSLKETIRASKEEYEQLPPLHEESSIMGGLNFKLLQNDMSSKHLWSTSEFPPLGGAPQQVLPAFFSHTEMSSLWDTTFMGGLMYNILFRVLSSSTALIV